MSFRICSVLPPPNLPLCLHPFQLLPEGFGKASALQRLPSILNPSLNILFISFPWWKPDNMISPVSSPVEPAFFSCAAWLRVRHCTALFKHFLPSPSPTATHSHIGQASTHPVELQCHCSRKSPLVLWPILLLSRLYLPPHWMFSPMRAFFNSQLSASVSCLILHPHPPWPISSVGEGTCHSACT